MSEIIVHPFTGGPFAQNGYLVRCAATNRGILVDPGGGVAAMMAAVRASGVEIESIVLTHAHIDHVDGIPAVRAEIAAPILLHPDDEPLYRAAPTQAQWFGVALAPLPPTDGALEAGQRIRFGECELEVRFTPGHAPGHVVLVGDGLALVGDCVFAGSIGRTDLPGGDLGLLLQSIRAEILTLPDETVLYPGHGPETTVGHERVTNPFLAPQLGGSGYA